MLYTLSHLCAWVRSTLNRHVVDEHRRERSDAEANPSHSGGQHSFSGDAFTHAIPYTSLIGRAFPLSHPQRSAQVQLKAMAVAANNGAAGVDPNAEQAGGVGDTSQRNRRRARGEVRLA